MKEADLIDALNTLTIETGNNTVYGVSIFPTKMECYEVKDETQETAESIAKALDVMYIFYNQDLKKKKKTTYYYTCDFKRIYNYIKKIEKKNQHWLEYCYLEFEKIKMVVWDFDRTFMRSHWLSTSLKFKYPLNEELTETDVKDLYKLIFDKIKEKKKKTRPSQL